MQIFSVPLGVISLVAISTNAIFTSVLFEMIDNSTGVVQPGSKRKPFWFFSMEFHRNVELNFEMSLGARVALIFSRDVVRDNLADTHRENKSSSIGALKHGSSQCCDPMELHMVYVDVWECYASSFMLTAATPEYVHYFPTLLFGSLPQSQYKSLTFKHSTVHWRTQAVFRPFIFTTSVSPFSPFAANTIYQLSPFIRDQILLQPLGIESNFCISLPSKPYTLFKW